MKIGVLYGCFGRRIRGWCAPKLVVTQDEAGRFACVEEGRPGSPTQGSGASVLEAVGSWAIYSEAVSIICSPPAVLREFSVGTKYVDLDFAPPPSRESD